MSAFDVFNGDADGVLALHQFRLAHPQESTLITGVKRDVNLIGQLRDQCDARVVVFDISLEINQQEVLAAIARGCSFTWFDHHRRGDLLDGPRLETHINLAPTCCSALLVDEYLGGQYHLWAVAAAYGDNLRELADQLSAKAGLSKNEAQSLKDLGETINYNGYGEVREDLNIWPADLYLDLKKYENPFEYSSVSKVFERIQKQKQEDERVLGQSTELYRSKVGVVILLPEGSSSKRMSGIFSNDLVHNEPEMAHAILTHLDAEQGYRISIRAPLSRLEKADTLAKQFPTGGGRAGAAGVNQLPKDQLPIFFQAFEETFQPC